MGGPCRPACHWPCPRPRYLFVLLNLHPFPGKHVLQQTSHVPVYGVCKCQSTSAVEIALLRCAPMRKVDEGNGQISTVSKISQARLCAAILTRSRLAGGLVKEIQDAKRRSSSRPQKDTLSRPIRGVPRLSASASAGATVCPLCIAVLEFDWLDLPQTCQAGCRSGHCPCSFVSSSSKHAGSQCFAVADGVLRTPVQLVRVGSRPAE
jgi:hypothetical protein